MLSVIHPAQDPASDLFAAFMMAAASAEDLAATAMAIGDDNPSAADAERLRGYSSRRSDRFYRNTQFS
jgi:hypothetical protein